MSNRESKPKSVPRPGRVIEKPACYKPARVPLYLGNPLIETLPGLPKPGEMFKKLRCSLPYDPADRLQTNDVRYEMLEGLRFFFRPLTRHYFLAQAIFGMLRTGYASRNPAWGKASEFEPDSALVSAALLGFSGTGKTRSVRRILRLIDQVILHTNYPDGGAGQIDQTQVTWLNVECPHDASPRGLCTSIFQKFDKILGTDYDAQYGGSRSTTNIMIPRLIDMICMHHLGILVIDEIQNLFNTKTSASKELEDFIVRIVNDFEIPVLMVGTRSHEKDTLNASFRIARRMTGLLQPNWGLLENNADEWRMFLDGLWKYQYVREEFPMTDELSDFLYNLTKGVPDFAVKLYFLAQVDAINGETENLSKELFLKTAEGALKLSWDKLSELKVQSGGITPEAVAAAAQTSAAEPPPAKSKRTRKKKKTDVQDPGAAEVGHSLPTDGNGSSVEMAKELGLVHDPDDAPDSSSLLREQDEREQRKAA